MIRILGVLLVSVAAAFPGFVMSHKLSRRKKYLDEICLLTLNIKNNITDGGDSITEILNKESFGMFLFLKDLDFKNLQSEKFLCELLKSNGICYSDSNIISEFFKNLGVSDTKTEQAYCDFYYNKFTLMAKDAKTELNDKGKLFKSVFLSLGAVIFIFLI